MRRSPIEALFPGVRGKVLATLFLDPGRSWYLSDLARQLGLPASSLQRDLGRLAGAGILRRRKDGNRIYYEPSPECPFLPELSALLTKTTGVLPRLRDALQPLAAEIDLAFVYGSAARAEDVATSDVDLLVVGTLGLRRLTPALRKLQIELGREIHPTLYSPLEFATKRREGNSFLDAVLAREKLFVVGSENDLGRSLVPAARRTRRRKQRGAR
jgi:DNA-binding transcriptional ArsR family regulator